MMTGKTNQQLRKIYALKRQLGMDNDELHCLVQGMTGVESLKLLNIRQAARVIDRLDALAGGRRDVPGRASEAQQRLIQKLAEEMGWAGEPSRLRGFLEAKAGVSDVRFLSIDSARRIIEALKAIQKGGRAERRRELNERLDE